MFYKSEQQIWNTDSTAPEAISTGHHDNIQRLEGGMVFTTEWKHVGCLHGVLPLNVLL